MAPREDEEGGFVLEDTWPREVWREASLWVLDDPRDVRRGQRRSSKGGDVGGLYEIGEMTHLDDLRDVRRGGLLHAQGGKVVGGGHVA